jgi:N-formylglutamate amidohydrolase
MNALPPWTILHIPHAATAIPSDVRRSFVLDDDELQRELLAMTDHYTDELFALPPAIAVAVRYPWSRLVVDPERFLDGDKEPMTGAGMGAVYERTSTGARLRRPLSEQEREALIERFYRPYHTALDAAAGAALGTHGRCLVVDCHSFPSVPLPYEFDQRLDRPDICIGTDRRHTPPRLRDSVVAAFAARELTVMLDRPFAGTFVPSAYHDSETRVQSVMIEVNRRLYMHEQTGRRCPTFETVRGLIGDALLAVIADAETLPS